MPLLAVIVAAYFLITQVIIPNSKYNDAVALMDAGQYEEAIVAFEAMDGIRTALIKRSIYDEYLTEKLKQRKPVWLALFFTNIYYLLRKNWLS